MNLVNIFAQSPFIALAIVFLLAAIIFTLLRLIKGPSIPDRFVAIDQITFLFMGLIVIYIILENLPTFLDVILVLALLTFLGVIAYARYLGKGLWHE